MEKQIAVDRILEVENLTDNLEDDDANWLINWGISRVPALIDGVDDETAGTRVNALMAVMRKLNQIVGDREVAAPDELAEYLSALADRYQRAFGEVRQATPEQNAAFAATLAELSPRQALQALLDFVCPVKPEEVPGQAEAEGEPAAAGAEDQAAGMEQLEGDVAEKEE